MRGVEELRTALADWLTENGLEAVTAWRGGKRKEPGQAAVAAVSLRGLKSDGAGFQNYLGERYNDGEGRWEELYGKQVELTFGLDLYAATAEEVQAGVDLLRDLLDGKGPGGMDPRELSVGETAWQQEERRYMCPAQARFSVWAVAVSREDSPFLDFEVRGETVK